MTAYACNFYWNPDWLPTIGNLSVYPLVENMTVFSGTPTASTMLFYPSAGNTAWQPVVLSGMWPGLPAGETGGFQNGDTIYFAFQVAGGNTSPSTLKLSSAKLKFMRALTPGTSGVTDPKNPLGIVGGTTASGAASPGVASLVPAANPTYQKFEITCLDFEILNTGRLTAQAFKAFTSSSGATSVTHFTFSASATEMTLWVASIEATYNSMTFRHDPEWKVGGARG